MNNEDSSEYTKDTPGVNGVTIFFSEIYFSMNIDTYKGKDWRKIYMCYSDTGEYGFPDNPAPAWLGMTLEDFITNYFPLFKDKKNGVSIEKEYGKKKYTVWYSPNMDFMIQYENGQDITKVQIKCNGEKIIDSVFFDFN